MKSTAMIDDRAMKSTAMASENLTEVVRIFAEKVTHNNSFQLSFIFCRKVFMH